MSRLFLIALTSAFLLTTAVYAQDGRTGRRSAEGALYDATGKRMGPVAVADAQPGALNVPRVRVSINGAITYIPVTATQGNAGAGLYWDWSTLTPSSSSFDGLIPSVAFESSDCSGTSFVFQDRTDVGVLSKTIADNKGGAYVYIARLNPTISVVLRSGLMAIGSCIAFEPRREDRFVVTDIVDLATIFQPPYTVR